MSHLALRILAASTFALSAPLGAQESRAASRAAEATAELRVVDAGGAPIVGAVIGAKIRDRRTSNGLTYENPDDWLVRSTDARGSVAWSAPEGVRPVVVDKRGFVPRTVALEVGGAASSPHVVVLQRAARVEVVLVDAAAADEKTLRVALRRRPADVGDDPRVFHELDGARSTRFGGPSLSEVLGDISDFALLPADAAVDPFDGGRCVFDDVMPGVPFVVDVDDTLGAMTGARTYVPALKPGEVRRIDFRLPPATGRLDVEVLDAAGAPLPGATVFAHGIIDPRDVRIGMSGFAHLPKGVSKSTDGKGRTTFDDLRAAEIALYAQGHEAIGWTRVAVDGGRRSVTLRLQASRRLHFDVVDAEGRSVGWHDPRFTDESGAPVHIVPIYRTTGGPDKDEGPNDCTVLGPRVPWRVSMTVAGRRLEFAVPVEARRQDFVVAGVGRVRLTVPPGGAGPFSELGAVRRAVPLDGGAPVDVDFESSSNPLDADSRPTLTTTLWPGRWRLEIDGYAPSEVVVEAGRTTDVALRPN